MYFCRAEVHRYKTLFFVSPPWSLSSGWTSAELLVKTDHTSDPSSVEEWSEKGFKLIKHNNVFSLTRFFNGYELIIYKLKKSLSTHYSFLMTLQPHTVYCNEERREKNWFLEGSISSETELNHILFRELLFLKLNTCHNTCEWDRLLFRQNNSRNKMICCWMKNRNSPAAVHQDAKSCDLTSTTKTPLRHQPLHLIFSRTPTFLSVSFLPGFVSSGW